MRYGKTEGLGQGINLGPMHSHELQAVIACWREVGALVWRGRASQFTVPGAAL